MNEWVRRSIQLANYQAYLDKLHKVYPVSLGAHAAIRPFDRRMRARSAQLSLEMTMLSWSEFCFVRRDFQ
jgi:hypothetical protein